MEFSLHASTKQRGRCGQPPSWISGSIKCDVYFPSFVKKKNNRFFFGAWFLSHRASDILSNKKGLWSETFSWWLPWKLGSNSVPECPGATAIVHCLGSLLFSFAPFRPKCHSQREAPAEHSVGESKWCIVVGTAGHSWSFVPFNNCWVGLRSELGRGGPSAVSLCKTNTRGKQWIDRMTVLSIHNCDCSWALWSVYSVPGTARHLPYITPISISIITSMFTHGTCIKCSWLMSVWLSRQA